jgi:hypothetical protein
MWHFSKRKFYILWSYAELYQNKCFDRVWFIIPHFEKFGAIIAGII